MMKDVSCSNSVDIYRNPEVARRVPLRGHRMWNMECHVLGEVERDLNTSGLAL